MVPLFGAVPGGLELLVVLLVFVFLFGVPLAILLLGGGALGAKLLADSNTADSGTDERIDRLEEELAETKAELRELRDRNADDRADESDQTESRSS